MIKELKMDAKFIEKIESGQKTRTARLEPKADIGDIVSIFSNLYVITARTLLPFHRIVAETFKEEGFASANDMATELYRIYGSDLWGSYLWSHKFKPYTGEIQDILRSNGHDTCFGCSNRLEIPTSYGGDFYCRCGMRQTGYWHNAKKEIEPPKRCKRYDGEYR